jgi:hypothetical protein
LVPPTEDTGSEKSAAPGESSGELESFLLREVEKAKAEHELAAPEDRAAARVKFSAALRRFADLIMGRKKT